MASNICDVTHSHNATHATGKMDATENSHKWFSFVVKIDHKTTAKQLIKVERTSNKTVGDYISSYCNANEEKRLQVGSIKGFTASDAAAGEGTSSAHGSLGCGTDLPSDTPIIIAVCSFNYRCLVVSFNSCQVNSSANSGMNSGGPDHVNVFDVMMGMARHYDTMPQKK